MSGAAAAVIGKRPFLIAALIAAAGAALSWWQPGGRELPGGIYTADTLQRLMETQPAYSGLANIVLWTVIPAVVAIWSLRGTSSASRRVLVVAFAVMACLAGLLLGHDYLWPSISGMPRRYHYYYIQGGAGSQLLTLHALRSAAIGLLLGAAAFTGRETVPRPATSP